MFDIERIGPCDCEALVCSEEETCRGSSWFQTNYSVHGTIKIVLVDPLTVTISIEAIRYIIFNFYRIFTEIALRCDTRRNLSFFSVLLKPCYNVIDSSKFNKRCVRIKVSVL